MRWGIVCLLTVACAQGLDGDLPLTNEPQRSRPEPMVTTEPEPVATQAPEVPSAETVASQEDVSEPPAPVVPMPEQTAEAPDVEPPGPVATVAPAGTPEAPAPSGHVIVAGSETVACQLVFESTLTIGEGADATVTESSVYYARLRVDGLTRENFVSAFVRWCLHCR